jgi:hypothetical protein
MVFSDSFTVKEDDPPICNWKKHRDYNDLSPVRQSLARDFDAILEKASELGGKDFSKNLFVNILISCVSTGHLRFGDTNIINLCLERTSALTTQAPLLARIFSHEIGHVALDTETSFNVPRYFQYTQWVPAISHFNSGYIRHMEYRADAFGAEVMGKDSYLEAMKADHTENLGQKLLHVVFDGTHPLWEQRIRAVEKDSYRDTMLHHLDRISGARNTETSFDSWQDYLDNRQSYKAIQKSI